MRFKLRSIATRQRARLAAVLVAACLSAACARSEAGDHTGLGSNAAPSVPAELQQVSKAAALSNDGELPPASSETASLPPLLIMKEELRSTGLDLVYFAGDSSTLLPESRQTLVGQVAWLKQNQVAAIVIEGHADERGTLEYNIALGARRAAAVRDFLVSQGVAADRVQARSYGKERPIVSCDDIICWSQNRRAQTVPISRNDNILLSARAGPAAAGRPWQ